MAPLGVSLPRGVVGRIIRRKLLARGLHSLGRRTAYLGGPRRRGALQESGALREDGLKCVDIFLETRPAPGTRELDAREGAAVGAQVPSRNEVARGGLVVDLGRRRQGEVELRREV